jgi:hypothetical protein
MVKIKIKKEPTEPKTPSDVQVDSRKTKTHSLGITKQTLLKVPECLLLEVNKWLELMPDTWQCCLCNYTCTRRRKDLGQKHVATQHLTCDLCKEPFPTESYSSHMESVHLVKLDTECLVRTEENSPIAKLIQVTESQLFKCIQCCSSDFQAVKHRYKITEHIVTKHLHPKTYSCDFCLKTFWKRSEYDKHVDTVDHHIGMYQYAQSAHATLCSVLTQPLVML